MIKMMRLFMLVACLGVVSANFNKIMDEVLELADGIIAHKGLGKLPLPNIKYGFNDRMGFIDIGLGLSLNGGRISNLSTIRRMGDVDFPLGNDSTITLDAVVGLDQLEVHFDDFITDLLFFKLHHNVSVKVKNNAVAFELAIVAKGKECLAQVNKLRITSLSGISVKFYPNTIFDKLEDKVVSVIANIAAPILKFIINPKLAPIFNDIINKLNVCSLIPIPHI